MAGDDRERNVFVVHGRNGPARDGMFEFLRRLGLRPLEWEDVVAMTGSAAPYVGAILDAAFDNAQAVVVLLTPDEVAYLRPEFSSGPDDDEARAATQARPNVLFEAGMALGRHPNRTALFEVGATRPFSDAAGRHTIRFDGSVGGLTALAKRLETAGCPVDRSNSTWRDPTLFSVPTPPEAGLPLGKKVPSGPAQRRLAVDLRFNPGSKRLTVSNRGTEVLREIGLKLPEDHAAFHIDSDSLPIDKLPAGKSVQLQAFTMGFMGDHGRTSFDVEVTARTEDGEAFTADVFLDIGGG